MTRPSAVAWFLVTTMLVTGTAVAGEKPVVLIVPFDNASGATAAPQEIATRVARAVTARGWTLAAVDVEKLLEAQRVRYLDSLEEGPRAKILAESGAEAVVTGTIFTYAGGRNPVVAVTARLVLANGTVAWSDISTVSAEDNEKLFGLGRKTEPGALADSAVAELMRAFPRPGEKAKAARGPSKPLQLGRVRAFRTPLQERGQRVCILPFENQSSETNATRVIHDMLILRLAADPSFEIVDPAELRAAAREVRIGSFRGITNADLARVGKAIDANLFIRGTIYRYVEPGGRAGDAEIDLELSMLDVAAGRIVWAAHHERRGSDYIGLFLLGAADSAPALADRVVTEIAKSRPSSRSRVAEAFVSARVARAAAKRTSEKTSALQPPRKIGEKSR